MERKINKKYSINLLNSIVPISQFNKGQAGKIFNDVTENGAKIVIKNNEPECVLISPAEYTDLIEQLEDMELMKITLDRMKDFNNETHTLEETMNEFEITEKDLEGYEDIELEWLNGK